MTKRLISSSIILIIILIMVSARAFGAIDPDVVKDRRFFFVQYVRYLEDMPVGGFGTLSFGAADYDFRLQANDGTITSGNGTYGVAANGTIGAMSPSTGPTYENKNRFVGITNGLISSDGSLIAGGQDAEDYIEALNPKFFFAIRAPAGSAKYTNAELKGTYSFITSFSFINGSSFGYVSGTGKITFDGNGNASFTETINNMGNRQTISGPANYSLGTDGSGILNDLATKYALGVSEDRKAFVAASISSGNQVTFLIGMKDPPDAAVSVSGFSGAYALLRMAPDFPKTNFTRDLPYVGLGYVTSNGTGSLEGEVTELHANDPVGPYFSVPLAQSLSLSSSGTMTIRSSNSPQIITAYRGGPSGAFLGAITNQAEEHGIVVAFRTGVTIGSSAVVDAAQFKSPVAPGSIVSIFGEGLGPWKGLAVGLQPNGSRLKTESNGVSITVNGIPCPLFYVSFRQVNCQMPFEVAGQARVSLAATFAGVTSLTEFARIAPVAPGLFQGAIANAVSGRVITEALPARPGDYLVFYMTGLGQVDGGGTTGQVVTGPQRVSAGFRAQVNWKDVPADYAGLTPGFVGLYQVNIRLPGDLPPGTANFNFSLRENPLIGIAASFPVGN